MIQGFCNGMLCCYNTEPPLNWIGQPGRRRNRGGEAKGAGEATQHVGKFRNLRIWCSICPGLEGKNRRPSSLNRERGKGKHPQERYYQTQNQITSICLTTVSKMKVMIGQRLYPLMVFKAYILASHFVCLLMQWNWASNVVKWVPRKKLNITPDIDTIVPSWTPGVGSEWQLLLLSEAHFVTAIKPDMFRFARHSIPI